MSRSIVDVFPPEMIGHVVSFVEPEAWLQLKHTCKAFRAHMPQKLVDVIKERETQPSQNAVYLLGHFDDLDQDAYIYKRRIQLVHRLENHLIKDNGKGSPQLLLCTGCGLFKSRGSFADAQRKLVDYYSVQQVSTSQRRDRSCIACSAACYDKKFVLVNRKNMFGCYFCQRLFPQDEQRLVQSIFRRRRSKPLNACKTCIQEEVHTKHGYTIRLT